MYEPRVKRKYVGSYEPKIDAELKARGRVEYFDDVTLKGRIPRMIYCKIFRSPYCNARMKSLDTSEVEKSPGVYYVLRFDDEEVRSIPITTHSWTDTAIQPRHRDNYWRYWDHWTLNDTALWVGEKMGFAVAAETEEQAEEAMKKARIEWEILGKPALFARDALKKDAYVLHPEINPDSNRKPRYMGYNTYEITEEPVFEKGDVETAFREAEVTTVLEAACGGNSMSAVLDFRGCVIDWKPNKMTVWSNAYFNEQTRMYLSLHFNLPMHRIRVLNGHCGAHMGRYNCSEDTFFLITAILSKRTGRPVKYMMDQREDFHDVRNYIRFRVGIAGSKDGRISAVDFYGHGNSGAYHGSDMYNLDLHPRLASERLLAPVPNVRSNSRSCYTNRLPGGVMRGIGNMQLNFPLMQAIDQFAEEVHMDTADIIKMNIGNPHNGYPNNSLAAVVDAGAADFGWKDRHPAGEGPVYDGTKRRGMGMAVHNQWHAEWQETERGRIECEMRLTPDIHVILNAPTVETGAGGNSACVMACAENLSFLNMTPDDVMWIDHGDTEMGLRDVHPSDSVVSFLLPELMPECAAQIKEKLKERALRLFTPGVRTSELDVADARVFLKGRPDIGFPCTEVMDDDCTCIKAYVQRNNNKNITGYPYGAWFAEVEVDTELGTVDVRRITICNDVGQVMHASGAESQQIGGQCIAVGESLYEELQYDRHTGTLLNPNFIDYKIPLMCDFPDVHPILKEVWRGAGEYGACGLAEGTTTGTYAAVANAIYNAVGVRVPYLPCKPQMMLDLLAEKEAKEKNEKEQRV